MVPTEQALIGALAAMQSTKILIFILNAYLLENSKPLYAKIVVMNKSISNPFFQ